MNLAKRWHFSTIDKLGVVGLVSSLSTAAVATIWSVYIYSFLGNAAYVGFLMALFTIAGVLSYIFLIPVVEKYNKVKLYTCAMAIYIISYLLFALLPIIYVVITLGIIISIIGSMRITLFGIIFRDKTRDDSVSKNQGIIYTLTNISWFISPLIAGFIASRYSENKVFFFAAAMFFISFLLFHIFKIKDRRRTKKIDNPVKTFVKFFKNKERIKAYIIGGGIDFWWSLIYIYMPIYIIQFGLNDAAIGYFLGAIVLPLVLIEYPISKQAGRDGFKKFFVTGYAILGIAAVSVFFIQNIYLTLTIITLSSFGAAMLEPTTEAYFFDSITKKQRDKFYGPYNTTADVNSLLGKAIPAAILIFLPFKSIFLFFGAAMFFFAFISLRTKKIIEKT